MLITLRTKLSLCQFLDLFDQPVLHVLLEKHRVTTYGYGQIEVSSSLKLADPDSIQALIDEVLTTKGDLRNRVNPRYRFDERWNDFEKCLLLDGYKIQKKELITIEPVIEAAQPLEDDLTKELNSSGLNSTDEIVKLIKYSADSFRKSTPNYNACLSHARLALETLVRAIAQKLDMETAPDNKAWGKSLSHIKTKRVVTDKEEAAIASAYTFISDGAHIPVGFNEEEFARFGRNLAMAVCYFIIKKFNSS